jgi:hypothetical protein
MNPENETTPSAENPGYLDDLWLRLDVQERDKPPEEWTSQKAKREIERISDPLFISKARAFLDQKLKGKIESGELHRLWFFLSCLLRSPIATEARILLIELFKRPKMTLKLRVALTQAATWAKTPGVAEYVIPLFSNRNEGYQASQYLEAVPDPAAVDALGKFFLEQSEAGRGAVSQFELDAMIANISPRWLKYVVPILEKERQGKSEADINPRLSALCIIGKIGDASITPLVIKELETYSDKATICSCLFALSRLADERTYDLYVTKISQYIKKYFESAQTQSSSYRDLISSLWPYFQKLGRDKTPEVIALVRRLAAPQVWQRLSEEDQEFLEERYRDLAAFPNSDAPRQRLAAIYRDETLPMPERISAINELLKTFRSGTREEVVKKYIAPESEKLDSPFEVIGEGNIQFAVLQVVAPDGSKHLIRIRRSEKRNAVV